MIYYVRNKNGDLFKLDYPCFGMLSNLDDLSNSSWRNDLWKLNGSQWEIPREHRNSDWGSHSTVDGFDVDDLETIYLPLSGQDVNITHPFFNRLTKQELPDEIIRVDQYGRNNMCIVLTLEAGVPCDELFMPLFAVREIIENTMCSAVHDLVKGYGVPDELAVFFGASFYKSRSWNYNGGNRVMEDTFYPLQVDGGTFSNGKVGDFISIMNGERPRYISSVWGSMSRGYPAYGVTEVNHDDDDDDGYDDSALDHEDHDGVVGRIHHMNDSLVLQSRYDNEFANKHLSDSSLNRMAEQEFRSFVMEILQYVNYSNQSGT